jgi:hypothetical protein
LEKLYHTYVSYDERMQYRVECDETYVCEVRDVEQKPAVRLYSIWVQCPYLCPELLKPASLYHPTLNIPKDELELKAMVKKAAQVAKDHPTLKVPEVMVKLG